jgi:hypothetical protein
MNKSERVQEVKEALRSPYTWPGGYPKAFVVHDGCLCSKCVFSNFRAVISDTSMNVGPWNIQVDVLWEGEVFCVECGEQLEVAYESGVAYEE